MFIALYGFLFCNVPVDCDDCGGGGGGAKSSIAKGSSSLLLAAEGDDVVCRDGVGTLRVDGAAVVVVGVSVRVGAARELSRAAVSGFGDKRPLPTPASPIRTSISTALSRSILTALRMTVFWRSSKNPISRSLASLLSRLSPLVVSVGTLAPKICDALLRSTDELEDSGRGYVIPRGRGDVGGWEPSKWPLPLLCFVLREAPPSRCFDRESGKMDVADRRPKRLGVFGGIGGGISSDSELPVSCRTGAGADEENALLMYFWRMKRSMAESASSTSTGTGGLCACGL